MPTGIYKRAKECNLAHSGNKFSDESKKKMSIAKIGTHRSEEIKKKISIGMTGEKSPFWKGNKVGYFALHTWVARYKGNPDTCTHCEKTGLKGHSIQWANVDHKYRRNLEDYIRLCAMCHTKFDRQLKLDKIYVTE